jgi:hypothetical protein
MINSFLCNAQDVTWFEKLTGFKEISPENVKENLTIEGSSFISKVNGKRFDFGELEISTLEQLKHKVDTLNIDNKSIKVSEVVANVKQLHCDKENENALFQAASQFNLLEMVNPNVTPEFGIEIYENDNTQGPACAIACGAGTIYRNYFVEIENQKGQTFDKQIDCLDKIGEALENNVLKLWTMQNGYVIFNKESLMQVNKIISNLSEIELEKLKEKLKIGIQWNTEVTISENKQKVSQIYCSALPVAYSNIEPYYWEAFAKLILEATYEATFNAAVVNYEKYGSNKVFLTLVGGGAFGNDERWIIEAINKTINKYKNYPLDVRIVSYGKSKESVKKIEKKYTE